ncbi:MAG: SDR family oxidoreductase [Phycisphaeraceae bacterium]|nr:SDR family oxidoreductase [Phycisphaeraceae bacterium]
MQLDLSGKRALVCGSTQGIGRAVAHELAALGASVTLLARNAEALAKVRDELPKPNAANKANPHTSPAPPTPAQEHHWLAADFADLNAVRTVAATIADDAGKGGKGKGGSGTYHILINNTGGPAGGPIAEANEQAFADAFSAHLLANQILTRAVLPGMKAAGYGRIINIISTSVKAPIPGLGVSNTIRAAVASWAKTLAGELAPFGITVNNVLPGFTDTARLGALFSAKAQKTGARVEDVTREAIDSIPMRRLGRAEEIAAAAAFLASPAAGYITGINLPVDGGRLPVL